MLMGLNARYNQVLVLAARVYLPVMVWSAM